MSFFQRISSFFTDDSAIGNDCFLALDIGTSSVKAAVFKIQPDQEEKSQRAVILGVGKSFFRIERSRSGNVSEIFSLCQEARKEAENMAGIKTEEAIVSMAGQFVAGCSHIEPHQREKPEKPIDLSEIKNVIQKLQWKILGEIRKKGVAEYGFPEIDIKLASGRIISIKIDGYKVTDPIGFQGKELSLNIFNTFSHSPYLKFFERLEKKLQVKIVSLLCQPYSILEAVANNIFKANSLDEISCVLIDCGGRGTDVSFIGQGLLEGPKTIGIGGEAFSKRLAAKLNLKNKEAEELKIKYSNSQISSQVKRKITDIISSDLKIWQRGIETVFSDFPAIENFPSQILLSGGASALPGIKRILEDEDWQKELDFSQPIKARFISAGDIAGIEDTTGLLGGLENIALLSMAKSGLGLFRKESVVNSVLNRVIRLMQN